MSSAKLNADEILESSITRTIEQARPPGTQARPSSERFDRSRFESGLKKMDAVADPTDTDEAWDSIMSGIRSARAAGAEGA